MTRRITLTTALALTFVLSLQAQVKPGIDVLAGQGFECLAGKRVGLVTNPTGVNSRLESTIDVLHRHVNLVALFGPEHGVRGDVTAGGHVEDMVDEKTGLPVYSLYGSQRKPDARHLEDLDVLVYDIQDIGVRSYTYISTMGLVMEAAAEADLEVVILDRPNPLGGHKVEGSLVEEGYFSFVSPYPIPYIYGLTCGELALLLNQEGMLGGGVPCRLHVVPMEGWSRDMMFEDTGLPWVPTSPHIPYASTAFLYPATGIVGELDAGMIGIGYTLPFQVLVTEHIDAAKLAEAMNALRLPGVAFRPIHIKPYYSSRKGASMQGVQIHLTDPREAVLTEIQFYFLQEAHRLDPGFNPLLEHEGRHASFDRVCGSAKLRESIMADLDFSRAREYWRSSAETFRKHSRKYQLYD